MIRNFTSTRMYKRWAYSLIYGAAIIAIRTLFALVWVAVTAFVTFSSEKQYTSPMSYPPSGALQGISETFDNRRLHIYYGVPFIRPALLHNRFKRLPIFEKPWPFLLDATHPPPSCRQRDRNVGVLTLDNSNSSEDCLYLNIYVPARKTAEHTDKYPVIVIIYGGGYYSGGNSFPFYSGKYLAAYGNVMVVVPNYRLGIFGFYRSSVVEVPGDQGLWDLYAALKWVNKNAAAFGGNPGSVTLMGHEVGAALLGLLNTITGASQLYHRSIMMSGSPFMRHWSDQTRDKVKEQESLLRKLGCGGKVLLLDCLRSKPDRVLLDFVTRVPRWQNMYLPTPYEDLQADASVDLKATAVPKDLLIGTTENEGAHYANFFLDMLSVYDRSKLTRSLASDYLREIIRGLGIRNNDILVNYYAKDFDVTSPLSMFAQAMGDLVVNCPMKQYAVDVANTNVKVYMYVFKYKPSYSTNKLVGPTHLDDLFLSLGYVLETAPTSSLNVTQEEKALSRELLKLWARFANSG